jgi:hypothetical protein
MSACAGSLTRAFWGQENPGAASSSPLVKLRECPGPQEQFIQAFRRQGPDGSRPAGQGFMSTQRRANRMRKIVCMERAGGFELSLSSVTARHDHAHASGGTAPAGFSPEWLATNSLQTDYRNTQLVRLVRQNIRRGSPPPGAGRSSAAVTLRSFGSSLSHIPSLPGSARLPLSLPRVPVANSSRTERYDGKGNMYLQHAA